MATFLWVLAFCEFLLILILCRRLLTIGQVTQVKNKARKFGAWKEYYHVKLVFMGKTLDALLTENEFEEIAARALHNKEDL